MIHRIWTEGTSGLPRQWRRGLEEIGAQVIEKYPAVADHLPGHGLGLAVVRRDRISSEWHFPIEDDVLRDQVIEALDRLEEETGLSITRERSGGVLVVCSMI